MLAWPSWQWPAHSAKPGSENKAWSHKGNSSAKMAGSATSASSTVGTPRWRAAVNSAFAPSGQRGSANTACTRATSCKGSQSAAVGRPCPRALTIKRSPLASTKMADAEDCEPANKRSCCTPTPAAASSSRMANPAASCPARLHNCTARPSRATVTAAVAAMPPPTCTKLSARHLPPSTGKSASAGICQR